MLLYQPETLLYPRLVAFPSRLLSNKIYSTCSSTHGSSYGNMNQHKWNGNYYEYMITLYHERPLLVTKG
jgi:hypothetical protein